MTHPSSSDRLEFEEIMELRKLVFNLLALLTFTPETPPRGLVCGAIVELAQLAAGAPLGLDHVAISPGMHDAEAELLVMLQRLDARQQHIADKLETLHTVLGVDTPADDDADATDNDNDDDPPPRAGPVPC